MGYAVGDSDVYPLGFLGYGVPAYCDVRGCGGEIDRGLGYKCEEWWRHDLETPFPENIVTNPGCGFFFCGKHELHEDHADADLEFREHPEWIDHVLNDDTWQKWRDLYPAKVEWARQQV